jgi:hypothetical protein
MSGAAEALAETFGKTQPSMITEGITHRQLSRILKDAAAEAEARVLALTGGGVSDVVGRLQARQIAAQLETVSTQLWTGTGRIIQAGIYQQAALAVDQAMDLELLGGMPGLAGMQLGQALHFEAAQVVEDIISRKTNGFNLAERIYANGKVSTKQVGKLIDQALAQQLSAKQLAKQVKGFYSPDVPGGVSYASMRLARTEINNAHHTTTIRMAQDKPWVRGFKWNLSESHPRPDECNEYATRDVGLGAGVFPKGDTPSKPHPQCLCYLTHIQDEDDVFLDKLVSGEYDEYLGDKGVFC